MKKRIARKILNRVTRDFRKVGYKKSTLAKAARIVTGCNVSAKDAYTVYGLLWLHKQGMFDMHAGQMFSYVNQSNLELAS